MRPRTVAITIAVLCAGAALVWAVLRLAAAGGDRVESVVLVDFDFTAPHADPAFGVAWDPHPGLDWFRDGWAEQPDSAGVWTVGDSAVVEAYLLGMRATIQLECTTTPELAAAGQSVDILVDGRVLGSVEIPWGWTDVAWRGIVPADLLRQGYNEIVLRPARHLEPGALAGETRPVAIFVRRLRVTAWLDGRERARWDELTAPETAPRDWSLARAPGWTQAAGAATAAGQTPPPVPDPSSLPDVLILVTDAAHAAHLGCYGYARPTTPHLDALARGGVRMEAAFSPAPFTPIAVASLMSGLSWRDHGVVRKGQVLADSVVTLAEVMHGLGYFTLCLSDNLFVSRAGGFAQGFDQFDELWKHPRRGAREDNPEIVETVFGIRTRKGFDGRPLFAYLHMMPPHTPYAPGPDHDLWRDPDYAGTIDGTADQIESRTAGGGTIAGDDLARLVSLYDGNLHRIDASAGRLLDAFRALGRDRPLLVVYLSDHGEAFGQHGWFQHLTTVYEEMTHVPLVLWPADAWAPFVGRPDRLLSLTDVMPLLLAELGVRPPAGMRVPQRFLDLLADPYQPRGEVAIRTTDHAHTYGLRTADRLLVFDRFGRQELFDTAIDPGETRNLRLEDPDGYRELLGRLRAILAEGAGGAADSTAGVLTPGTRTLPEEEQRRLRALGY